MEWMFHSGDSVMTKLGHHPAPPVVDVASADWSAWHALAEASGLLDTSLPLDDRVPFAARGGRALPASAHDALVAHIDRPDRTGGLLLRGVPLGHVPATPTAPTLAPPTPVATGILLTVARLLGQPVGYLPEHGGEIVQHIVPTPDGAGRQVSTSSDVELMFHTETAFHPHRPRQLLLLCLRGDPAAATTLASVHEIVRHLTPDEVAMAFEPRFRTSVDASFLGGRTNRLGPPRALLEGTLDEPTFVFDADLMVGIDPGAEAVVARISALVHHHHASVVLRTGDLLVVDNHLAVHGRSPFRPRFDGTDRWLQRSFVVTDLAPSAADRHGRVITTLFGDAPTPASAPAN